MARILIADDEPAYQSSLRLALQEWGHEVEAIGTAEAADDISESFIPDLLVTDGILDEGTEGPALRTSLNAINPSLKTILMTGSPAANREGYDAVLEKPFALEELRSAIDKSLADG